MNRAYGCFQIWKYIRKSLSIPEVGKEEVNRRASILNRYGGIFSGVLYATENAFITDLYKFFDKPKDSLKLQTLIQNLPSNDIREANYHLSTIQEEIKRIKTLRHNITAHEPKNPQQEKIYTLEIEKIFSVVQKVLNIISKSHGGNFITWYAWEGDNEASFSRLLKDLELGYHSRINNQ